jgi:hypothetical protein
MGVETDGKAQGVGLADDAAHGAVGNAPGEVVSAQVVVVNIVVSMCHRVIRMECSTATIVLSTEILTVTRGFNVSGARVISCAGAPPPTCSLPLILLQEPIVYRTVSPRLPQTSAPLSGMRCFATAGRWYANAPRESAATTKSATTSGASGDRGADASAQHQPGRTRGASCESRLRR